MANQKLSSRYANALMQLAAEANLLDKVFENMQLLRNSIADSKDLALLLKSPIVKGKDKIAVLDKAFQSKIEELSTKFLHLLVNKGRESYLSEICEAFINAYNAQHKIAKVTLTTAIPATEKIIAEVTTLLTQSGKYNKVAITQKVDESIIGGFILKMDDQLLDNSIQHKLRVIKKELQH